MVNHDRLENSTGHSRFTIHHSRAEPEYDVVIAGASFAGLAVAQRLGGRALLIDKDALGDGVTSACGAPLSIVRMMGAEAAVQQVHDALMLHTPSTCTVWPLPEPFCTFDYREFCRLAFARTGAEFLQAAVLRRQDATVQTSAGEVSARFQVDATGWRAALIGGPSAPYVNRRWMAFGIETEVDHAFEPGLHFYFLPEVRAGYAWAFPCDGRVRLGVLSYLGRTKLGPGLERFVQRFGVRAGDIHGGYLASGLRAPVVDGVFVVGDASGQCLPLTGEGIRTAVLAGFRCGDLLQDVLDGTRTLAEAAQDYVRFVDDARRRYRALLWGNIALLALPLPAIGGVAGLMARPGPLRTFMSHYLQILA